MFNNGDRRLVPRRLRNWTVDPGLSLRQLPANILGRCRVGRLDGKAAIVVGAGSIGPGWGNGKATAVTFAREGARVFCVDRNAAAASETVEIIRSEGGKALAFSADASRAEDIAATVA